MKLSIVILTYNSAKYIKVLLQDIEETYDKEIREKKLEIVVCDNNSSDETVSLVKLHKDVSLIESKENLGFAKGINLAAKKAKGEILLFLNPDTKLLSGNFFAFVSEFDDPKLGVLGGGVKTYKETNELSCGKVYNAFNVLLLTIGLEESLGVRFSPDKDQDVDMVSGAFLAIKKELFEKIHGFDEHFFMYVEDAELCYRVKKEGFRVRFSKKASIKHMGQGSSNRTFAVVNIYRGLLYFHKKHMGHTSYIFVKYLLSFKAHILVLLDKISHNEYLVSTYAQALKSIS